MKMETVPCPICGSESAVTVRTSADIVKCLSCHIVYLRTRMTADSMFDLYQNYACEESHMRLPKNEADIRLSRLRREAFMQELLTEMDYGQSPKGALLDIGCGWGAFLLNAKEKGFERVFGDELTRASVEFAKTQGLDVYQGQLENWSFNEELNVVTAIHSLEHLPYPAKALQRILELLKSGGMFAGIVPNIQSLCSQAQREKWGWLDPNYHYIHFSPTTLRRTLLRFGFRGLKIYTPMSDGDFDCETIKRVAKECKLPMAEIGRLQIGEEIHFFCEKP